MSWDHLRNIGSTPANVPAEAKQEDDQEILQRMAKAWIHVARAEDDVTKQAELELPKRQLNS
jgi:hypothetical protein